MPRVRTIFYFACAVVLLASAAIRGEFANRDFILDEAWVANSVVTTDWKTMFFYPEWLQTSPPLFLMWLRIFVHTLGLSHMTLELPAHLSGILAVLGMVWIGRKRFGVTWRWLAITLVALSPTAIYYSTACKQYSGELFATVLLYAAVVAGREKSWRARSALLTGAGVVAVLLAYGSVFILPGIALWLLVSPEGGNRWQRLPWIAGTMGILALVFGAEYLFYIRPNTNDELRHFFQVGPLRTPLAAWMQFNQYLGIVVGHFFRVDNRYGWRFDQMVGLVGAVVYGVGSYAMWRTPRLRHLLWKSMLVWELPVLLLVVADIFGVFPFVVRTSLFIIPGLALAFVRRLEFCSRLWMGEGLRAGQWRMAVSVAMILLAVVAVLTNQYEGGSEQSSLAYRRLRAMVGPGDVVFVHRSMQQQFELEEKLQGPMATKVMFGMTGPGCCARPEPPPSSKSSVSMDLEPAFHEHVRRIWFYHTNRKGLWDYLGLDEPKVVDEVLRAHGYRTAFAEQLRLVGIEEYELTGEM